MDWQEFTDAREKISQAIDKDLSLSEFEKFLGAGGNSSPNWKKRGFPVYIDYSVKAHLQLPAQELKKLAKERNLI